MLPGGLLTEGHLQPGGIFPDISFLRNAKYDPFILKNAPDLHSTHQQYRNLPQDFSAVPYGDETITKSTGNKLSIKAGYCLKTLSQVGSQNSNSIAVLGRRCRATRIPHVSV